MDPRLRKLKKALKDKCDAVLLVSSGDCPDSHLAYFARIPKIISGYFFWEFSGKPRLIVSDYWHAKDSKPAVPVEMRRKGQLVDLLKEAKAEVIGINAGYFSLAGWKRARKARKKLVDVGKELAEIRAVKDKEELRAMRKASRITGEAFELVADLLEPGITEKEIHANLVSYFILESDGPAFDPIVASGRNSLYIHVKPRNKKIKERETVIVDMGASVNGYYSDFSRTFLVQPKAKQLELVEKVLEAWDLVKESVYPGMTGGEAWEVVREAYGDLAKYWPYGLGHGVGLDVHEYPSLGEGSKDKLEEGMVFTLEPGLHIPGVGGSRFEDTGVLTKSGFKPLASGF